MNKLTTYFGQALGKQTLTDAVKAGGWKILIDGTLAESLFRHGPGGTLVGTDQYGNRYYEKKEAQMGRDRWVVYAGAAHYTTQDPSAIPPEWHGWLNRITDENPTSAEFKKPIYAVEATAHPTGTADRYQPKGSWFNEEKRNWRKYQAWVPPQ